MREFYFEDKVNHYFITGIQPHDDVNCPPCDYFMYSHATAIARNYIQIAEHTGELEQLGEDFFYQLALTKVKIQMDNIMRTTYPNAKFQQILANVELNKDMQVSLWKGVSLSGSDLFWWNWLAQGIGYLLDIYHIETAPMIYKEKHKPMMFYERQDGRMEMMGDTDMSEGQMRAYLNQRKVVQTRIYHQGNIWHCLYHTAKGLDGREGNKPPHYHYLSDKWGITREELQLRIRANNMPSSKVHIWLKK